MPATPTRAGKAYSGEPATATPATPAALLQTNSQQLLLHRQDESTHQLPKAPSPAFFLSSSFSSLAFLTSSSDTSAKDIVPHPAKSHSCTVLGG